jgi:hypothetical protein
MSATLSADAISAFESFQRNFRWAKENDGKLDKFEGKFVAVDDQKVIASGESHESVQKNARDHPGAYITFVVKRGLIWIL